MSKPHSLHNFMLQAIDLSRRGFGLTAPNPCVGALIMRDNTVLAQGWHKAYGEAHAERMALADAAAKGVDLSACSMLVTLEPCNHYGKTPPCTEAILNSGIKHVLIGALDPNPKAAGGAERLRAAGIRVESGIAGQECLDNIRDFLHFQSGAPRPYTILKLASTLDGRIATRTGHSQWVSSATSLQKVHWLRSRVQAVMVGSGTFVADNPRLNAREDMLGHKPAGQPLAVVLASRLPELATRDTAKFSLLQERPEHTIFFTAFEEAASPRAEALRGIGVSVYGLQSGGALSGSISSGGSSSVKLAGHASGGSEISKAPRTGLNLEQAMRILYEEHNCHYVLCEGGGKLGLSLLRSGLADELLLFVAPKILGDNKASPLFDGLCPNTMDEALNLRLAGSFSSGPDIGLRYLAV